ncbi:FadR/GntR family transcriptional regulator [Mycobacterium sp. WMMD1722]|uniref:FadR/GntR family transcriptional regulator n=1 Tax=Mycobacterium sp. WMMD1722 TaxID=3404117 RepID=UPI003BF50422
MAVPQTSDILREVIFSPLEHGGRTKLIFDRLRNAVALDVFKDGEQLPPETELAAQLGISPVTLRDALGLMREAGLVETRRGRTGGSFVRRNAYDPVAHGHSQLEEMSLVDLRDLSDWRISLAEAAASLSAQRASDDEVNGLAEHVSAFAGARDSAVARRAEGRLFIALAAASQSVRLTRATVTCVIDYGPLLSLAYQKAKCRRSVARQHSLLVTAVSDGDREAARAAVREAGADVALEIARLRSEVSVRKT